MPCRDLPCVFPRLVLTREYGLLHPTRSFSSLEIAWMRRADGDVSARVTQNERGEGGGEGAFVLTVCCQPLLYAGGLRFLRLPHSLLDLAGQKEGVRVCLCV